MKVDPEFDNIYFLDRQFLERLIEIGGKLDWGPIRSNPRNGSSTRYILID